MKWDQLQHRIRGTVTSPNSPNFSSLTDSLTWNEIKPARTPYAIVTVQDEQDVIEAIHFAKEHRLKIVIHGGGHSWIGIAVRNKTLIIDLSQLNEVKIDKTTQTAQIQPVISNQELALKLAQHNLAFPIGHCPTVKASGYLLNGGMSWNMGAWGPACLSVEAIEFVTAAGDKIKASATEHPDLFWAARGCGPAMFAVATRFHLKCYPLPQAILTSTYFCALEQLQETIEEVTTLGWQMPNFVELSAFLIKAPPTLEAQCQATNGKLCMISAVAFANTEKEGTAALAVLEKSRMATTCLLKTIFQPSNYQELLKNSGATWPENHRNFAENQSSKENPVNIFMALRDKFIAAPSPKSVFVLCLSTGQHNLLEPREDVALSMEGQSYGGPWAIWENPKDDAANRQWQNQMLAILKPFTNKHYVGETDFVQDTTRLQNSFTPKKWQRLQQIRAKYDPNGLFVDYLDGLVP